MLPFFTRGTRFGRALIFSALLLLVGIVFSVMHPFYSLSDLLGWSDAAGGITLIDPFTNVPDNAPVPGCKVAGATIVAPGQMPDCKVADATIVAPGQMPANAIYIRKVKPGPFAGMLWSPFVNAFFDLWMICAIVGCYILVQETLNLVTDHFRSREESPPSPQG